MQETWKYFKAKKKIQFENLFSCENHNTDQKKQSQMNHPWVLFWLQPGL